MKKMTYGSLFAGVGGFDLGLDAAGYDCRFQVEWDKNCQKILKRHWPDVPKYGDVTTVNGYELEPVDMIIFGSPCQDLSNAGKRVGLTGDRSSMFFEAVRIIKEMRNATNGQYPKWAIWENVAGALTSNQGEDFAEVLNQMANIGALAIEWHILDAQWFGVPQRRRRVFLVSCWDSSAIERSGGQILPVPKDSGGNLKKIRKARKSSTGASEDGDNSALWSGASGCGGHNDGESASVEAYVKTIRSGARDTEGNLPPEVWESQNVAPTLNTMDNTGESRSTVLVFQPGTTVRQGAPLSQNTVPTLRAEHHNGDNMPHVLIIDGTRVDDFRLYGDGIVPTLKHRMGTGGGQVPLVSHQENHPVLAPDGYGPDYILRRLTPLECERLMGFPDDHTKYDDTNKLVADTNRYKMCGNAVASPVAKWIGDQIMRLS